MRVEVAEGVPAELKTEVRFLREGDASLAALPAPVREDFAARRGQVLVHYSLDARHVLVGLGAADQVGHLAVRKAVTAAVDRLREIGVREAAFIVPDTLDSAEATVRLITVVAMLDDYVFDKHLSDEKARNKHVDRVVLVVSNAAALQNAVSEAMTLASSVLFARDLGNERADVCTPEWMEARARELVAQNADTMTIDVVQFDELKRRGMNLLAAVGGGATVKPRLVSIEYKGNAEAPNERVGLLGKGITFDSGGLNMKATGFIETMYMDMCGSAAVLGALRALAGLKAKCNVVGILCLAENAVDADSYKPHAIIRSYKGLTVSIGNTDAEGRLVMCDGLTHLQREFAPQVIIDLATLTGACVIALGEYACGLFSNSDELRTRLQESGWATHERAWSMPIFDEHRDELTKAYGADLNNMGAGRMGGACIAAAFLERFIEPGVRWAHLDIAGPAMYTSKRDYMTQNATGFGVQMLVDYVMKHHQPRA